MSVVVDRSDCPICYEAFTAREIRTSTLRKPAETIRRLGCTHFFHKECLDPWEKEHNSCPECRSVIDPCREVIVQVVDESFYIFDYHESDDIEQLLEPLLGEDRQVEIQQFHQDAAHRHWIHVLVYAIFTRIVH